MTGKRFISLMTLLGLFLMPLAMIYAQEDATCPGAPQPRLTIGAQARVLPGDANNVRDAASRAGAMVGSIPGGEVFTVLDGPTCADGFNWWQIEYGTITGWTVEGSGTDYWVEPYDSEAEAPTAEPTIAATEVPASAPVTTFESPVEAVNQITVGAQVRVLNDDPDSDTITLTIRATPGRSGSPVAQAVEGDLLTIVGDSQDVDGLRWWQVETARGSVGWVIEGLVNAERDNAYERTLLAVCPAEGERVIYRLGDYVATSAPDGSEICILDAIYVPAWMTFSPESFILNNRFILSPDGSYALYDDSALYRIRLDGSERLALPTGSVAWAAWSPDGERIAVATGQQIATMRADGSGFSALTQGRAIRSWVGWMGDSETVIYAEQDRWQDQMGTAIEYVFYRVNIREGGLREVLRTLLDIRGTVAISPDGTTLAVSGYEFSLVDGMRGTEPVQFYDEVLRSVTLFIDPEAPENRIETDASLYDFLWTLDSSAIVGIHYGQDILQVIPVSGDTRQVELTGDVLPDEYWNLLGWESDTRLLIYRGYGFQVEPDEYGIWAVDIETGEVTRRS